jgi:hypothetical protein
MGEEACLRLRINSWVGACCAGSRRIEKELVCLLKRAAGVAAAALFLTQIGDSPRAAQFEEDEPWRASGL